VAEAMGLPFLIFGIPFLIYAIRTVWGEAVVMVLF
jgi:hypothetical protein